MAWVEALSEANVLIALQRSVVQTCLCVGSCGAKVDEIYKRVLARWIDAKAQLPRVCHFIFLKSAV